MLSVNFNGNAQRFLFRRHFDDEVCDTFAGYSISKVQRQRLGFFLAVFSNVTLMLRTQLPS